MGFIVLVLVIGTLIAAIWGRSVAQGYVAVVLGGAAVLLGGLVLLIGVLLVITPSTNMSRAHGAWDAPPPGQNPFSTAPRPYYAPPTASTSSSSPVQPNVSPPATPIVPNTVNIVRPRVGIAMRSLTPEEDSAVGLRAGIGQCVTYVVPGGGAAAANVVPGDEITKVYVRNTWYWVATQGTVTQAVEASPAGSWTWMEMLRNGRIYRVRLQSAACVVRRL